MGLTENLSTQNVMPDAISQATSGVTKGLDAGLAYAQAQQKSNEMGSKIDMMNSEHETKKMSYLMSQLNQISQTPNKSYKNILVKSFSNTHQKFFGTPPSSDMQEFLKNVPEASAGINKLLEMYPNAAKDPQELLQFKAAYAEMFGGNLSDVPAAAEKMISQNTRIIAAQQKQQMIGLAERRLTGMENNRELKAIQSSQNAKPVQEAEVQLLGADKGLNIINKAIDQHSKNGETMTWSTVHEVTGDLAQITSAKLSAVVPVAKQLGIEKDIPKLASLLGQIDTEFKQGPSKTVPISVVNQLRDQFGTIRKVLTEYHKQQFEKRIQSGVDTGVVRPSIAKKTLDQSNVSRPIEGGTSTQTQAPATQTSGVKTQVKGMNPGKSFSQLFPAVQKHLISKGIDQKTYDAE